MAIYVVNAWQFPDEMSFYILILTNNMCLRLFCFNYTNSRQIIDVMSAYNPFVRQATACQSQENPAWIDRKVTW